MPAGCFGSVETEKDLTAYNCPIALGLARRRVKKKNTGRVRVEDNMLLKIDLNKEVGKLVQLQKAGKLHEAISLLPVLKLYPVTTALHAWPTI